MRLREVEVRELVVEQEPIAVDHDTAAAPILDRERVRHDVTCRVGDGQVRRVRTFGRAGRDGACGRRGWESSALLRARSQRGTRIDAMTVRIARSRYPAGAVAVDRTTPLCRISLAEQA